MLMQSTRRERLHARRSRRKAEVFILIAMLGISIGAHAAGEDTGPSIFSFSGFGTLGVVHSSEDNADFTSSSLQPNGAGYTHSWSPDVDSRLGAQVTARFTPQFSAMLQVISEQRYDKTYRPFVEWANITYQPTPEFSVRLGRIVLPTFLISDTRKVGYANHWVRPPVELYSLSPIFDNDGASATYTRQMGEVVNTLQGIFGHPHFRAPPGGVSQVKQLWVIADTVEYRSLTLHIAYQASSYNYQSLDVTFDAFRDFGPQGIAIADRYDLVGKQARVITAGVMYDPGKWFATGEWAERNLHSAIGESTAWYLSGGYRLAKFTPYLTYAERKSESKTFDPGLDVSALAPDLVGTATGLNTTLNEILALEAVQRTISVGSRWDVMRNIDVKLQYDRMDLGAGSAGTLINVQPAFQRGGTVNLLTIAIDFVW
jgi:hypothetical protein